MIFHNSASVCEARLSPSHQTSPENLPARHRGHSGAAAAGLPQALSAGRTMGRVLLQLNTAGLRLAWAHAALSGRCVPLSVRARFFAPGAKPARPVGNPLPPPSKLIAWPLSPKPVLPMQAPCPLGQRSIPLADLPYPPGRRERAGLSTTSTFAGRGSITCATSPSPFRATRSP